VKDACALAAFPARSRIVAESVWGPSASARSAGTSALASEARFVKRAVRSTASSVTARVEVSTPEARGSSGPFTSS
jgi:hypothetical protein